MSPTGGGAAAIAGSGGGGGGVGAGAGAGEAQAGGGRVVGENVERRWGEGEGGRKGGAGYG